MSSACCLLLATAWAAHPSLPPGFWAHEVAASGTWDTITGLAAASDGRLFVIEKRGRVHVVENDVKLPVPFLDIEREVLNNGDRGLLGIALDPLFAENGFVYLLYTVDPNGDGIDSDGPAFGRLTRYTASAANPNVADPGSRKILIGDSWSTGIPSFSDTHTIGSLRFGLDGTLLVSSGDGAHAEVADAGHLDSSGFGAGKTNPAEDIGAFRSQWPGSLAGKILRIDPATGGGLPSNPFYTGNPFDNASRVWAYGLRNPFRFTVRPSLDVDGLDAGAPGPGTLYISDVGWITWEEVDVCGAGGMNFGWPCHEGPVVESKYSVLAPAHNGCDSIGSPENPAQATEPLLYWNHNVATLSSPPGVIGHTATGIAFYTGTRYPTDYRGACFFADYEHGWIRCADVDAGNALVDVRDFAADAAGPVDIASDPASGDLIYVSIIENKVWRIRYGVSDSPPVANASAEPTSGEPPLTVQFSSGGTSDPDNDPLTYIWQFGDGTVSIDANPSHVYTAPGSYSATMTVEDDRGGEASAVVPIEVANGPGANHAPVPVILEPEDGGRFVPLGEVILRAAATDVEDAESSLLFTWEVILHHNTHIHPAWLTLTGPSARFVPGDHDDGTGVWLEIVLRVKDTQGLTASRRVSVYPEAHPLVMDNGDPGTSSAGKWYISGGSAPYGIDSVYAKSAGASYTYSFSLPTSGVYKVFAWWTAYKSRSESTPYTIVHSRGSDTITVNQKLHGNQWNQLGIFAFGNSAVITLTCPLGGDSVSADALLLLPDPGVNIPPRARIDAILPNPGHVGEPVSFTGRGEDEGSVVRYEWRSSLDGLLSTDASFTTSSLSAGTHAITLRVEDDRGALSEYATATLQVSALPLADVDVIIDDGQPGTSFTGSWKPSGGAGAYGSGSLYSRNAGDSYTFAPALPTGGRYEVFAWWTQFASRAPAARYTITTAAGDATVQVDQRINGGTWISLGTYDIASTPKISLASAGGGFTTCADAVRLVLRGDTIPQVILDNGAPGTSSTGSWIASSGPSPYGGGSLYSKGATASYTYVITIDRPGTYEVLAWWTSVDSRSTQVTYTITHAAGTAAVQVNQRENGGQWSSLGTFQLAGSASVRIDALPDGRSYCADAVCVRRMGE